MIAGLPVHWVNIRPLRSPRMPAELQGGEKVYVQGFDGSQPQHPMYARHVHWENVVAYAVAHDSHDQDVHHNAAAVLAVTRDDFYPGDGAE